MESTTHIGPIGAKQNKNVPSTARVCAGKYERPSSKCPAEKVHTLQPKRFEYIYRRDNFRVAICWDSVGNIHRDLKSKKFEEYCIPHSGRFFTICIPLACPHIVYMCCAGPALPRLPWASLLGKHAGVECLSHSTDDSLFTAYSQCGRPGPGISCDSPPHAEESARRRPESPCGPAA